MFGDGVSVLGTFTKALNGKILLGVAECSMAAALPITHPTMADTSQSSIPVVARTTCMQWDSMSV